MKTYFTLTVFYYIVIHYFFTHQPPLWEPTLKYNTLINAYICLQLYYNVLETIY